VVGVRTASSLGARSGLSVLRALGASDRRERLVALASYLPQRTIALSISWPAELATVDLRSVAETLASCGGVIWRCRLLACMSMILLSPRANATMLSRRAAPVQPFPRPLRGRAMPRRGESIIVAASAASAAVARSTTKWHSD